MPATADVTDAKTLVTLQDAASMIPGRGREKNIGYTTLRRLAVVQREFTVHRDAVGHGHAVFLLLDEVKVFAAGRLPALRKFRRQKGRS